VDNSPLSDAEMLDRVFKHCRIVFYPSNGEYPIEHAPHARKDAKDDILAELAKLP
jgi:hypothetical protein